jgi:DNA-binding NarL/FixJ family response regulator/two-component sensor histidine kinase
MPHRYGDREVQSAQEVADHLAVAVDCGVIREEATAAATAAERSRLARELHDSLAQTLAGIVLALDAAADELATDAESAVASLDRGRAHARRALGEARRSIWSLQPAALASGSLAGALEREAAHARAAGLDAALHIDGDPCSLDARCEEALYRIAQEAISNVRRHADASRAAIELAFGEAELRLLVSDDGVGFDPTLTRAAGPGASHGFGLSGIQERARLVGGRAEIRSAPGRGTVVVASIPVVAPSEASLVITPLSAILPAAPAGRERIRVLIVDDHELVRHGLRHMLQREPGLEVVGEAADGERAIAEVLRLQPDIVLLDVNMPRLDGVEALLRLRELGSGVRTILLSVLADERLFAGLRAGARGYLPKDTGREAMARAIRTVHEGGSLLPPVIAAGLLEQLGRSPADALSIREVEILELLALGARNKEVAATLSISENTVRWHAANLYQKLAVTTRTEAIHVARQRGLLPR